MIGRRSSQTVPDDVSELDVLRQDIAALKILVIALLLLDSSTEEGNRIDFDVARSRGLATRTIATKLVSIVGFRDADTADVWRSRIQSVVDEILTPFEKF